MFYLILSTAFLLGGIVIIYWLHNQYHLDIVVGPTRPPLNPPLISVCVPARNEERNICACVDAILNQDYPNFEVIVLDDRSTDSTPEILRQLSAQNDKLHISAARTYPQAGLATPCLVPGLSLCMRRVAVLHRCRHLPRT